MRLDSLTDDQLLLIVIEGVLGDLQVERSRASSNSSRNIVVRTVARAEPSSVISSLSNGDTTQVGADTQHDEPLSSLRPVLVAFRITQRLDVDCAGLVDLVLRSVSDEDGLSSPLDNEVLACNSC